MLQRVCIAMAIALSPQLLIADEPTSSLDITIESQIVNLFKELRQQLSLTVLFITHNLGLVKVLCDRAVVLKAGRVKEIQETSGLFAAPRDEYTKSLISSLKELE
jgi:peptide/nickel transport system ATP-binding protein